MQQRSLASEGWGPDRDRTGDLMMPFSASPQLRYWPTLWEELTLNITQFSFRCLNSCGTCGAAFVTNAEASSAATRMSASRPVRFIAVSGADYTEVPLLPLRLNHLSILARIPVDQRPQQRWSASCSDTPPFRLPAPFASPVIACAVMR